MAGHLHLTPPGRLESFALAHVLTTAGLDIRLGLEHDDTEPGDCAGTVALAFDADMLDSQVEATLCALGVAPQVVVAHDDVLPVAAAGSAVVVSWQQPADVVVAVVRGLVSGTLARDVAESTSSPSELGARPASLTSREFQIADLLSRGWRNEEIATELGISAHTVRTHVSRVFGKLGVQHRVALAVKMRREPRPVGAKRSPSRHLHGAKK